jgi:hypothetical protein
MPIDRQLFLAVAHVVAIQAVQAVRAVTLAVAVAQVVLHHHADRQIIREYDIYGVYSLNYN